MKPILFNTEMVRKILSGEKTVTRRRVKPQPPEGARLEYSPKHGEALDYATSPYPMPNERVAYKAPYQPGDVLYVRETWALNGRDYIYRADADPRDRHLGFVIIDKDGKLHAPRWRPSIHMPKEAARIFLRVTNVRVERLQEIDGKGRKAEGAENRNGLGATYGAFVELWNSTIKPAEWPLYGWLANPWVWVIEFERCEKPEEG